MNLRKILPMLVLMLLMTAILPVHAAASDDIIASGWVDNNIDWKITSDGTLTLSGSNAMSDSNIHWYSWTEYADVVTKIVVEEGVTSIGAAAFERFAQLTQVHLSSTITKIGQASFYECTKLTSIHIPAGTTAVGSGAFYGCSSLSEITFDPQIESLIIGSGAFQKTGIKKLTLPACVKEIGSSAFAECAQLTTLNLSEGLEVIGEKAFFDCFALTGHLYLPASLQKIGSGNFEYAASWTSVEIRTDVRDTIRFWDNFKLKSAVIAGESGEIPEKFFQNCSALTSVTLESAITEIGSSAFEGCTSLQNFTLPKTLQHLGADVFRNSSMADANIPDSVINVGTGAFADCKNITSAKLSSGMIDLRAKTFENCINLEQIDLANVQELHDDCLKNTGLTSVQIPDTARFIGSLFADCRNLTEIYFLGDAPGAFGYYCFQNVTATAYYNPERAGWTKEIMQDYGGTITWEVAPHPHDFHDGKCVICGTKDPNYVPAEDPFELYGANMTLGNNLAINFYIDTVDLIDGEDYYAVITKKYENQEDLVITIEDENWEEAYHMYRVTLDKIAAKEMADEITVVVYNDEGKAVSQPWKDSVRAYTMRMLQKEEAKAEPNVNQLALYVEMLNYGAAAQRHFKYNTGDLANNQLTNTQREYGLDEVEMHDSREIGVGYVGTSLTLESNIIMNFYFNTIPADHDDIYASVNYCDHYGDLKFINVEGKDFVQYNDTTWKVPVEGLVVADCREIISIHLYDVEGNTIAYARDSISGYTARMDEEGPLYVAIMRFGVAAFNSFHW